MKTTNVYLGYGKYHINDQVRQRQSCLPNVHFSHIAMLPLQCAYPKGPVLPRPQPLHPGVLVAFHGEVPSLEYEPGCYASLSGKSI